VSIIIRKYRRGDETAISELVCRTLVESNSKDYPSDYIENAVAEHSPEQISKNIADAHCYAVCDGEKIVGTGSITGYWGSTVESYLMTIFVLPEYQGHGIGTRIIETLESDEYFKRAYRTEVAASITAERFYRKLGYEPKNGIRSVDEFGTIRLEKFIGDFKR